MNKAASSFALGFFSLVASLFSADAPAHQSVSLSAVGNVYGIGRLGSAVTGGGIDGGGYAYAANLLGTSLTWSGSTFNFGAPGPGSAVAARVIPLPAGHDVSLSLLATGVQGNQVNQSVIVTYTDGSKTSFTQSFSDWHTPQRYPRESIALTTAYRITATGAKQAGTFDVYGYTFALNAAKTVKSLTLPSNRRVVLLALDVNPGGAPPSALSYPTPPPLLLGKNVSLTPTVKGQVTKYLVNPALPAGLLLDAKTGIISGVPGKLSAPTTYTVTASNSFGSAMFGLKLLVDPGPTVQLAVASTDANGHPLNYRWQVTDGRLVSQNGAVATWLLPRGPGTHFAYVVVGNGYGGFAERRIAVTTDSIGAPAAAETGNPAAYGNALCTQAPMLSPACQTPTGYPVRLLVSNNPHTSNYPAAPTDYAAVGATITAYNGTGSYFQQGTSDRKGSVVLQNVPANEQLATFFCGFPPLGAVTCNAYLYGDPFSGAASYPASNYLYLYAAPGSGVPPVVGSVLQQDSTRLGISESFFGLDVPATVTVGTTQCSLGPPPDSCARSGIVNDYGDFTALIPQPNPTALTASVDIENLHYSVPPALLSGDFSNGFSVGILQPSGTGAPQISSLTATYQGNPVVALRDNLASQPSDALPEQDAFLAFKGADTRPGACKYYEAIGAVRSGGCGSLGNFASTNAIRFEDWKAAVQIDRYATSGGQTAAATFVNAVDLNLTRVHHSVSYGASSNHVAAYVCNHAPPTDTQGIPVSIDLPPVLNNNNLPTTIPVAQQQAVNTAIDNAAQGRNLIACVAMDYMVSAANGGQPFTRFLVFGPDGSLLPSVNLDGRGEKFVPGACIACHGGDRYVGKYPEDGSGFADVGAHFLPYDPANFAFSEKAGLTRPDQEQAIYQLNQNVLGTAPTALTAALINGWYSTGPVQNPFFMPDPLWNTSVAQPVYYNVIGRSCRTCHAALPAYSFVLGDPLLIAHFYTQLVCGGSQHKLINHAMPNSLTAFNEFWNSSGSTTVADQPKLFGSLFRGTCSPPSPGTR